MAQKLFTKEIERRLQAQFKHGSCLEDQLVICKLFHPFSNWTWYLLNQDPEEPNYLWAIVEGIALEMGSVSKADLVELRLCGLPLERDVSFEPCSAAGLFEDLRKRWWASV